MNQSNNITLTNISKPPKLLDLKELWRYKDLFYFMVLRDVTVMYKQTVFGFAWAIFNPLIQIVIFTIVFGKLANVTTGDASVPYVLFSSISVIPWTYFSNSISFASNSIVNNASVFTKVYFPRLIIPLTPVISKLVDFTISLLIIIGVMIYFKVVPSINIFLIFIPILLIILSAAGIGIWLSALTIQYRDFKFALGFMLPLLMYVAPVAFPSSLILNKFGASIYKLYSFYPMVGGIESFKSCLLPQIIFPWGLVINGYITATLIFVSGLFYFRKVEKYFADLA